MPVRLMIVDDRSDVRQLMRAIVEDSPEDVAVAGEADGAAAALEAIDAIDPDVLVLDATMPELGGVEAAPMILERRPGQKIVLFSALVDQDTCDRAEAAGIAVCVSKDDLDAIPRVAWDLARPSSGAPAEPA
ncbi:MAG TPA: response regulator [Solirubrobacteraceae bacterium]|nr:response regulator [Solirubrobacteraceae bacterium]